MKDMLTITQAEEFSRIIGSEHYTVRVTDHEFKQQLPEFCDKTGQPYAVSSGLGVMSIAKMARELGIKVLLSGDGADEFDGYAWYNYLDNSGSHHFETTRDSNVSMHTVGLSIEEVQAKISTYSGSKRLGHGIITHLNKIKGKSFKVKRFMTVLHHSEFSTTIVTAKNGSR